MPIEDGDTLIWSICIDRPDQTKQALASAIEKLLREKRSDNVLKPRVLALFIPWKLKRLVFKNPEDTEVTKLNKALALAKQWITDNEDNIKALCLAFEEFSLLFDHLDQSLIDLIHSKFKNIRTVTALSSWPAFNSTLSSLTREFQSRKSPFYGYVKAITAIVARKNDKSKKAIKEKSGGDEKSDEKSDEKPKELSTTKQKGKDISDDITQYLYAIEESASAAVLSRLNYQKEIGMFKQRNNAMAYAITTYGNVIFEYISFKDIGITKSEQAKDSFFSSREVVVARLASMMYQSAPPEVRSDPIYATYVSLVSSSYARAQAFLYENPHLQTLADAPSIAPASVTVASSLPQPIPLYSQRDTAVTSSASAPVSPYPDRASHWRYTGRHGNHYLSHSAPASLTPSPEADASGADEFLPQSKPTSTPAHDEDSSEDTVYNC